MKEYIRYLKATSNGAGKYYVEAHKMRGNTHSTAICLASGIGEGASPEEAKADALRSMARNERDASI